MTNDLANLDLMCEYYRGFANELAYRIHRTSVYPYWY